MRHQLWILAEAETFFLPHLVARLAAAGRVAGIIELRYEPQTVRTRWRHLQRLLGALGVWTAFHVALSVCAARVLDALSVQRFYSLRKVARSFGLPLLHCRGFTALRPLLEEHVGQDPVLVQVSRRVPAGLTVDFLLLNKHCALLPRHAGVYPVFWCMLLGEQIQGVTVHRMDAEFDHGPILSQSAIPNEGSFFSIYHKLHDHSFELLNNLLQTPFPWKELKGNEPVAESSYNSFPTTTDRRRFRANGGRFGWPLRLHSLPRQDYL